MCVIFATLTKKARGIIAMNIPIKKFDALAISAILEDSPAYGPPSGPVYESDLSGSHVM